MKPSRSVRLFAVIVAVFSLLYTQLALASYVCPAGSGAAGPQEVMTDCAAGSAAGDCAAMDDERPSLCHAHAQKSDPTPDRHELPPVPPFAAAGLSQVVVAIVPPAPRLVLASQARLRTRSTAPPLAIQHCCFRI